MNATCVMLLLCLVGSAGCAVPSSHSVTVDLAGAVPHAVTCSMRGTRFDDPPQLLLTDLVTRRDMLVDSDQQTLNSPGFVQFRCRPGRFTADFSPLDPRDRVRLFIDGREQPRCSYAVQAEGGLLEVVESPSGRSNFRRGPALSFHVAP